MIEKLHFALMEVVDRLRNEYKSGKRSQQVTLEDVADILEEIAMTLPAPE